MSDALDGARGRILRDAGVAAGPRNWNVFRLDQDGTVGLLDYGAFEDEAFPRLLSSTRISPNGDLRTTDYSSSINPLILHRKELLLSPDHPRSGEWRALTARLIALGLFRHGGRIGRLAYWNELLARAGLDDQGRPA